MKKLKKILLIDDKINNYLNEIILTDLQITEQISVERNGEKALHHLTNHCELPVDHPVCPEMVILDHHMPVMDGLQLMKTLKERGVVEKQEIVFILLGVHSKKEDIEAFKKLGVHEYTDKPLSKEVVINVYQKYFLGDTPLAL